MTVPQYRETGGESRKLHRVGPGESSASAITDTNTSLQHRLPQNGRLQKYWDHKLVETPRQFPIFSM